MHDTSNDKAKEGPGSRGKIEYAGIDRILVSSCVTKFKIRQVIEWC